jgi:aspartokinase/homoserine dehydrogenase 1
MSDTCDGFDSIDLDYAKEIKAKGEKFEPNHKPLNSNEWVHILDQHVWSDRSQATILVDNTATESFDILFDTVKQGGHIVTANKKPLAVDQLRYDALFELAKENNCSIRYEATVGAGLPVIDSIEKLESSGDEIRSILGCLSGTIGYLMSSMEKGMLFSDAVREAYEKGFTEPDPREDLSGMDVARKALILARRLGWKLNIEDIKLESLYRPDMSSSDTDDFIENLSALDGYFDSRIKEANKNNCVLRYVARIENGKVSVGVENIPIDTPLGSLKGTDNQITITTRRYESNPLVVTGPGAGAEVTAAGVLNDIVAITMNRDKA